MSKRKPKSIELKPDAAPATPKKITAAELEQLRRVSASDRLAAEVVARVEAQLRAARAEIVLAMQERAKTKGASDALWAALRKAHGFDEKYGIKLTTGEIVLASEQQAGGG